MRKSINKTTVIIVLAVFLTLSIGYALFSDTITIEGTATAQGTFDIEGSCVTQFSEEFESMLDSSYDDFGYKNLNCGVSDDGAKVSYSVEFEYPGAQKDYAYSFTNNGTIKAELSDVITFFNNFAQLTVNIYNSTTNILEETVSQEGNFFELEDLFFQDKNGNYINANNDLYINYFDEDNGKIYLNPGDTMYIVYLAQWPDMEKYTQEGVYYEAKQTATLNWKQSTN